MKKPLVISLIVILMAGGVLAYVYFFYEKEHKTISETVNLNIATNYEKDLIKTGYVLNGNEGVTSRKGFTSEMVYKNRTNTLYTMNLDGQNFYSTYLKFKLNQDMRKNLDLKKAFPVEAEIIKDKENKTINLNLSSEFYKNPIVCWKWSLGYLSVDNSEIGETLKLYDNLEKAEDNLKTAEIEQDETDIKYYEEKIDSLNERISKMIDYFENPKKYKEYDECIELNKNLGEMNLNFEYSIFTFLSKRDEIEFMIQDRDYIDEKWVFELNGEDIGESEKIVKIK